MAAVIDFPYSVNDGEYSDAESVYSALFFPTTGDIWFFPALLVIHYPFSIFLTKNHSLHFCLWPNKCQHTPNQINALRAHQ